MHTKQAALLAHSGCGAALQAVGRFDSKRVVRLLKSSHKPPCRRVKAIT
jgi:hypothetical protein